MATPDKAQLGVEELIVASLAHGEDIGDIDATVGDLEILLRTCWEILTTEQRATFVARVVDEELVPLFDE